MENIETKRKILENIGYKLSDWTVYIETTDINLEGTQIRERFDINIQSNVLVLYVEDKCFNKLKRWEIEMDVFLKISTEPAINHLTRNI